MIEIIPKPEKEPARWPKILFYLSLALLIGAILGYFVLDYFEKRASLTLEDLEERLQELSTSEEKVLEEEVLLYQKQINDFSTLLEEHKIASNSFEFLEKITHPRLWFNDFSLNLETYQMTVIGSAPDFPTLGQQLIIFQKEKSIKEVNLTDISLGEEGKVSFGFDLSLDPQIFK